MFSCLSACGQYLCRPQKINTDTRSGPNPQKINLVMDIFHINFFHALRVILDREKLCCRFSTLPMRNHLGTFENFNITILNINQFFYNPNINIAAFPGKCDLANVAAYSVQR